LNVRIVDDLYVDTSALLKRVYIEEELRRFWRSARTQRRR